MYAEIILKWARFWKVPGHLLLAICTHETGLKNIVHHNDGGSSSYGICQIKAETARSLNFSGKDSDLMDPNVNAGYAAKYLLKQLDRYDGDWCMATAAYNAGRYNPSVIPGKPRNLKYIKAVTLHLDDEHKDFLICGSRKVASE